MTATYELASSTRSKLVLRRQKEPFIHLEFRRGYSKVNAFNLAILATAAYADEEPLMDWLFRADREEGRTPPFLKVPNVKSCFLGEAGTGASEYRKTFFFMNQASTDTQMFWFRTESYSLISCRGTAGAKDGLTDANAHRVPYVEGVGKVHEGFYEAFRSVRSELDKFLAKRPDLPVIVCGHSLGGALATLVAAYARRKYKREAMLYTYGCPIVGDADFARHFTSVEPVVSYRCVHNRDLVTMVPPAYANLRVNLLLLALHNPLYLLPATVDPFGKPYSHFGKLVLLRRLDGGAFSVDVDRKTPAYLRLPDSLDIREERPKWDQVLNWAGISVNDHFMSGYVSILGSDLKHAVHACLESGESSAANAKQLVAYLETEIAALEKAKAKAERDALTAVAGARADATASAAPGPGRLTPAERLRLAEDALRDKLLERSLEKSRMAAMASPAYRNMVLKEILDRPMSPSLKREFEYQDKNLAY